MTQPSLLARSLVVAIFLAAAWGAALVAPRSVGAAPLTDQGVDEAVDGTLGGWSSFPWYDSQTKEAKIVPGAVAPLPPPPDLSTLTVQQPTGPVTAPSGDWSWLVDLWTFIITYAPWLFLALLVVVLVLLLAWAYVARRGGGAAITTTRVEKAPVRTEIERLENLPFKVARSQDDLLGEARRQYEAGNYDEAIIYLFSYQLVELDRHQKLRLERGKTNRQYLRELRGRQDLANILCGTMYCFEDVFFGHHALERVEFEACWRRLGEFQQQAAT